VIYHASSALVGSSVVVSPVREVSGQSTLGGLSLVDADKHEPCPARRHLFIAADPLLAACPSYRSGAESRAVQDER